MLLGLILFEALCCLTVVGLLVHLWRPVVPETPESFARVLAGLPDTGNRMTPARPVATALVTPTPSVGGVLEPIEELTLSKRMAVIRHMLQGRTAVEVAATEQVDVAAASAIFRAHGRGEG
jgi:hypothetical protein